MRYCPYIAEKRMMKLNKSSKKSQMEIGQTMMILIIFFILLIFALIFFVRFQASENATKVADFNEKDMVEKAQTVYSLGEFGCSIDNVLKYDCIDILKLEAFKDSMSKNYLFYRKLLGNIRIEVEELYPKYKGINYTWSRNSDNSIYNGVPSFLYSSRSIQMPIVLYNASDTSIGSYYFGILTVTSYFRVNTR